MGSLRRVRAKGFKSIKEMDLELRPMNVLIGVNGAGKSNLVSFFQMLNEMMGGRLQSFIASAGRAQALLHFGPRKTPQIEASLEFETDNGLDTYSMRLFHAAGDTLMFAEERLLFQRTGWGGPPQEVDLGAGRHETGLTDKADAGDQTARVLRRLLNQCRVFHFHDTSPTARVRQYCYVGDDRWLMPDAGNLAAMLYRLRHKERGPAYKRILATVRRIAPFFADFELEPTGPDAKEIILNWRQKDSDQVFGPHQLSDGTLRAMSLVTLLEQPAANLPDVVIVDEPELGLHPAANTLVGGLLKRASNHCQVIVATQSAALLDCFDATDVVVVEHEANASTFRRLDETALREWLDQYTLGQLWEKNVIGGGPFS